MIKKSESEIRIIENWATRRLAQLEFKREGTASGKDLPQLQLQSTEVLSGGGSAAVPDTDTLSGGRDGSEEAKSSSPVPGLAAQGIQTDRGLIWVSRRAIMCTCPECQVPVSVRSWLMLADCWNCEQPIELSVQQRGAIQTLLQQSRDAAAPRSIGTSRLPTVDPVVLSDGSRPPQLAEERDPARAYQPFRLARLIRNGLQALPAWLISFLVHLVLLLILALLILPSTNFRDSITLSTFVGQVDREGGDHEVRLKTDPLQFDSLLPSHMELSDRELRREIQRAERDADELQPEESVDVEQIERLKQNLTQLDGPNRTLALRDPRLRNEILNRQGGTTFTEAAVARGLRWLARVQNQDGSWSLNDYAEHARPGNRGDCAATSLALLPFLGAGQTHETGRYHATVLRGIRWLLAQQKEDGDLRGGYGGDAGMYVHGQAAIVLVEALSMTGDEQLRQACEQAIRFIERAQHQRGGWRYNPGQAGDTSVFGWQLMALQSARASGAGIAVDRATWKLAGYFLDDVSREYRRPPFRAYPAGALYRYLPGQANPKPSMTAEGLLCRMYMGWDRHDPRLAAGVKYLMEHLPPESLANGDPDSEPPYDLYYWYYGTQVLHHFGGKQWEKWNRRIQVVLYELQEKKGSLAGSWNSRLFQWGRGGGRIYATSLAICTLEVYYRHLPLFERLQFANLE